MATIITIFKSYLDTKEPHWISVEQAFHRIQTGVKSKALIEQLRAEQNEQERANLKKQLPCICFAGRFMSRKNEGLQQHSGLLILDFDKLMNVLAARLVLQSLPFAYAVWISPSGNGLKMLVKIPANPTAHRGYFVSIQNYLSEMGMELDPSGKDVARICFESYDPDIYINPDAEEWTEYEVPQDTPPIAPKNVAVATNYGELNKCANMIRKAADGQKHAVLARAAFLAGGLVAGGIVREEDAIRVLESEIANKENVTDFRNAQKTIRGQIDAGKLKPIFNETIEEEPLPTTDSTHNVTFLATRWDVMKHQFKHGKARGESTFVHGLDGYFSLKKGEHTLWSGYPGSGKSEFVCQLMLTKSLYSGWKWAVYCPENEPAEEFYDQLIHALAGMSVDPGYANQMTPEQYAQAANFVADHFYLIEFPNEAPTIDTVEANFTYCIEKFGVQGVLIDPYNALRHNDGEREDQYLRDYLNARKRYAKAKDIVYFTICHPNGRQESDGKGDYKPLGKYNLSGGSMWANKIDNFIVIHRPLQESNPDDDTVEIKIRKIKKRRLVGKCGTVVMSYSVSQNRYYFNGRSALAEIKDNNIQPPKMVLK